MGAGRDVSYAAMSGLGIFISNPTGDDVRRYSLAAYEKRPVVFLQKNLGLTHPDFPFHVSSNV
eukprot:5891663-Alexandrium_andersonii.AAC.1